MSIVHSLGLSQLKTLSLAFAIIAILVVGSSEMVNAEESAVPCRCEFLPSERVKARNQQFIAKQLARLNADLEKLRPQVDRRSNVSRTMRPWQRSAASDLIKQKEEILQRLQTYRTQLDTLPAVLLLTNDLYKTLTREGCLEAPPRDLSPRILRLDRLFSGSPPKFTQNYNSPGSSNDLESSLNDLDELLSNPPGTTGGTSNSGERASRAEAQARYAEASQEELFRKRCDMADDRQSPVSEEHSHPPGTEHTEDCDLTTGSQLEALARVIEDQRGCGDTA